MDSERKHPCSLEESFPDRAWEKELKSGSNQVFLVISHRTTAGTDRIIRSFFKKQFHCFESHNFFPIAEATHIWDNRTEGPLQKIHRRETLSTAVDLLDNSSCAGTDGKDGPPMRQAIVMEMVVVQAKAI